jgi:hypothetical protein
MGGWGRRIESPRLGWATWQDPVSKNHIKEKNEENLFSECVPCIIAFYKSKQIFKLPYEDFEWDYYEKIQIGSWFIYQFQY